MPSKHGDESQDPLSRITVDIPVGVAGHSGPVQLFFAWSRGVIVAPPEGDGRGHQLQVDGTRVTVFPARTDDNGQPSPLPESIDLLYMGEAPSLIGYLPLKSGDDVGVTSESLLRRWLGCRMGVAMSDPAQRYFLRQDLEALSSAMINWSDAQLQVHVPGHTPGSVRSTLDLKDWTEDLLFEANRHNTQMGKVLGERLSIRAGVNGSNGGIPIPFELPHLESLEFITRMFASALRGSGSPSHSEIDTMHEDFAAGRLRDGCGIGRTSVREVNPLHSCDANSALVMLYAELGLGAVEMDIAKLPTRDQARAQRLSAFWAPKLNGLVRMQRIYLGRFDPPNDPKCFRRYATPEFVLSENRELVKDIAAMGDDAAALEKVMRAHAEHVVLAGGRDCFR